MRAACESEDVSTFFPVDRAGAKLAIEICQTCPIMHECRDYALVNDLDYGIWGGMTPSQRDLEMRKMRVGKYHPNFLKEKWSPGALIHRMEWVF